MASAASSPSVLMFRDEPHSAASIITPRMLLPFTARSSLRTSTFALKRLPTLTHSAAGGAWAGRRAGRQRPPAQRDVAGVVPDQKPQPRAHPEPQRHTDQREPRHDREPPDPHQPVAE